MQITVHHYHHFPLFASGEDELYKTLASILTTGRSIMETVQTLNDKLDALTQAQAAERTEHLEQLQAFKNEVKALSAQIAAGTPATQADLDALGSRVDQAITNAKGIVEAADKDA